MKFDIKSSDTICTLMYVLLLYLSVFVFVKAQKKIIIEILIFDKQNFFALI